MSRADRRRKVRELPPPDAPTQTFIVMTPRLKIACSDPMPNRWRRFWYWALLGWRWEAPAPAGGYTP